MANAAHLEPLSAILPAASAPEGRDSRQRALIPTDKMKAVSAAIVGVGAVGHALAHMLASSGVGRLVLIDHDKIEEVNFAPQGWNEKEKGNAKVMVAAAECRALNSGVEVVEYVERFRSTLAKRYLELKEGRVGCVFMCVDDIDTRRQIWETSREHASFIADARCAAEAISVLAVKNPKEDTYYAKTLHPAEESYTGECTARMARYVAAIAAGMMMCQWAHWLRGDLPVVRRQDFNLLLPGFDATADD